MAFCEWMLVSVRFYFVLWLSAMACHVYHVFTFHLLVALLSQFGLCTMLHAIVAVDPHSFCICLHDLGMQYDAGAVSLCACACICISD